jgi:hypothetical protein
MALLNNCELWFAKLDPKRPSKKFNKDNPTWELQLRTASKETKKDWENKGLKVKAILPDDDSPPYYRVNLRKKSIKKDGEAASPVDCLNSKLKPLDPNSIGNGSIGNVRVFQYDYTDTSSGKKSIASVLMGVQVTKHIVYVQRAREDDFEEGDDMETIEPETSDYEMPDDDIPF